MMPERKSSEQRNLPEVSIISRVFSISLGLCCMCKHVRVPWCQCGSQDHLQEPVLTFHQVGSKAFTGLVTGTLTR